MTFKRREQKEDKKKSDENIVKHFLSEVKLISCGLMSILARDGASCGKPVSSSSRRTHRYVFSVCNIAGGRKSRMAPITGHSIPFPECPHSRNIICSTVVIKVICAKKINNLRGDAQAIGLFLETEEASQEISSHHKRAFQLL